MTNRCGMFAVSIVIDRDRPLKNPLLGVPKSGLRYRCYWVEDGLETGTELCFLPGLT